MEENYHGSGVGPTALAAVFGLGEGTTLHKHFCVTTQGSDDRGDPRLDVAHISDDHDVAGEAPGATVTTEAPADTEAPATSAP